MDPKQQNLEFLSKAEQSLSWNEKVNLWKLSKNSPSVVPPLFGEQYLKNVFTGEKVSKERTCQQVLRAKHLLTMSVCQLFNNLYNEQFWNTGYWHSGGA